MLWVGLAFVALLGIAMIIRRNDTVLVLQSLFGARSHPGCAVVLGALLLLVVLMTILLAYIGRIPV